MYLIFSALFILTISACSFEEMTGQVIANDTNITTCTNECSYTGQRSCSGNYIRLCGNYDTDSCLEWTYSTYCSAGCLNGYCNNQTTNVTLMGTIYATSTPAAANVYVDNIYKGTTPKYIFSLSLGYHTVTFTKVGYISAVRSVNVINGTTNVSVVLAPSVNITPINLTDCTNDCKVTGQRQCSGNYQQICGNYDTDNCLDWKSTYCTYGCANGYCNTNVSLASLSIVSYPTGAGIQLDGMYKGITPINITNLTTGLHGIIAYKTGYITNITNVTLTTGNNNLYISLAANNTNTTSLNSAKKKSLWENIRNLFVRQVAETPTG